MGKAGAGVTPGKRWVLGLGEGIGKNGAVADRRYKGSVAESFGIEGEGNFLGGTAADDGSVVEAFAGDADWAYLIWV